MLNNDSPSNRLVEVGKDLKKEKAKIHLTKKNYIELPINPENRVDETFGYDGCIVVEAKFSSLSNEISLRSKKPNKKVDCAIAGYVILEKLQTDTSDLSRGHKGTEKTIDSMEKEILKIKKIHTEMNPFNK